MKLIHWEEYTTPEEFSLRIEKSNAVYRLDVEAMQYELEGHTHFFIRHFYAYRRGKDTIHETVGFNPLFPPNRMIKRAIPIDFKRAIADIEAGIFPKGWVFAHKDWTPYGSWKDPYWKQQEFIKFLLEYTGMKKEETL